MTNILRRLWVLTPVLVFALILGGALGFYLFTGWRAWDLTAKALARSALGNFGCLMAASAARLILPRWLGQRIKGRG